MRRTFHERAADVRLGRDAALDAWMYGLMVDNNIAYPLNPAIIAGPEQLAFMVWLEEGQVYLPCSDSVFRQLQSRDKTALRAQYLEIWQQTRKMVCRVAARHVRRLLLQFCRLRYRQAVAAGTILPTRLAKRMATSVLTFDDPWGDPWQEGRRAAGRGQTAFAACAGAAFGAGSGWERAGRGLLRGGGRRRPAGSGAGGAFSGAVCPGGAGAGQRLPLPAGGCGPGRHRAAALRQGRGHRA